uniref:Uncharacterized protein n=1 Tax=Arundo donax TaxID=35708 RepID=A0A0A9C451_ARUDO
MANCLIMNSLYDRLEAQAAATLEAVCGIELMDPQSNLVICLMGVPPGVPLAPHAGTVALSAF